MVTLQQNSSDWLQGVRMLATVRISSKPLGSRRCQGQPLGYRQWEDNPLPLDVRKPRQAVLLREPHSWVFACVIRDAAARRSRACRCKVGGTRAKGTRRSRRRSRQAGETADKEETEADKRECRRVYSQGKGASNGAMPHAELLCGKFRVMRGRRCQCRAKRERIYLQRPVSTAADRHDLKLGMPVRNWMGPLPVRK